VGNYQDETQRCWQFDPTQTFKLDNHQWRAAWMNSTNTGGGTLYRSPRGTGRSVNVATGRPDFNDPSTVSDLRNPDSFLIDAQARYDGGRSLGLKQKLELTLLVVNLLNNTDVQTINDRYSATGTNTFGTSNFCVSAA